MSIKTDLTNAMNLLKGRGAWCRDDLKSGTARCAVGAISSACGCVSLEDPKCPSDFVAYISNSNSNAMRSARAIRALARVIDSDDVSEFAYANDCETTVIHYNDRSSNKARVMAAFRKAIASL